MIGILDLLAGIFDGDVGLPDDMVIPGFGLSGVTALAGLGASLDTTLERNRIVGHVAGLVGVEFLGADMTVSARNNDFIANGIGVGLCALNGDTLDAKIDNNRFRGAGSGELVSGLTGENAPAFDLAAVVAFGMDEDALDTTRLTLAMNGNTVDNYLVGGAFLSYGVGSYVNADVYDNTFNGAGLGAISTFATPADVTDFIDDHDDVKKFFDTPGAPDIHAAIAANQGGVGLIFGGFGSGLGRVSGDVQRNVIRNYYAPAVVFVEGRGIADPVAIANNTGTANTGWTYIDDFGFIGLTALANTFPMTLYDP